MSTCGACGGGLVLVRETDPPDRLERAWECRGCQLVYVECSVRAASPLPYIALNITTAEPEP